MAMEEKNCQENYNLHQFRVLFIKCWLKCCQINEIPILPNGLQRLSFIYCISGSYLSCIQE